jgi:hypothetical protein
VRPYPKSKAKKGRAGGGKHKAQVVEHLPKRARPWFQAPVPPKEKFTLRTNVHKKLKHLSQAKPCLWQTPVTAAWSFGGRWG